ncbi:MAG: hypothetical protein LBI39_03240 [Puniceicoccales bacterium]|nr:hypothetical protein [Puniceicoccales bacterium]
MNTGIMATGTDRSVVFGGAAPGSGATFSSSVAPQVPPLASGAAGQQQGSRQRLMEIRAVIDLQVSAITHKWLADDIAALVADLRGRGYSFSEIVPVVNDYIVRFDAAALASWERAKQRRGAAIKDPEARKTLIANSPAEARLFAEMDKTDEMRAETAVMKSQTAAMKKRTEDMRAETDAMRMQTATMDEDFERQAAENQARIDKLRAESAASEARTKALLAEHEKKVGLAPLLRIKEFFLAIGFAFAAAGRAIRSFFIWIGWKLGICEGEKIGERAAADGVKCAAADRGERRR